MPGLNFDSVAGDVQYLRLFSDHLFKVVLCCDQPQETYLPFRLFQSIFYCFSFLTEVKDRRCLESFNILNGVKVFKKNRRCMHEDYVDLFFLNQFLIIYKLFPRKSFVSI